MPSPAVDLQRKLGAAITAPWAEAQSDDREARWPGAVRLAILLAGGVGSWALVIKVAWLLI